MAAEINTKFKSKLKQTFRILFVANRIPCDDTLLEKLYSLLESKLTSGSGDVIIVADTLNEVSWLNALFENWEVIDHCVVAFGLNIIGLLCITDETSKILLRHQESFKSFFAKLISNFSQLNASLRFATLKMLHKLCRSALGCFVMPNDILTLAMQSLTDNSIFVVRAAKDLMIYLVSTSLVQHSGELQMMVDASSSEEDDVTRVFQFMLKGLQCVDTGPQSKRKATVILDILNEICSNVPEVLSKLPHTSQLNSEITKIMLQIDDYSVCSSSCNTLLNLNDWSFDCGIQIEWLKVMEALLQNNRVMNAGIFLAATCERLHEKKLVVPPTLKSMLLCPVILLTKFEESNLKSPWNDNELKDCILNMKCLLINCEQSVVVTKLCCCLLSSLVKIEGSFETATEKLYLMELLFFTICDNHENVPVHSKIKNSVIDALNNLLDKWGCQWSKCICEKDHEKILMNAIMILENYVSPTSVMISVMKLFLRVIRAFHPYLLHHWDVISKRLTAVLRKRCDDPQWEIRDSAYEMLANITEVMYDQKCVHKWLLKSGLVSLAVVALDDTESYVRASALHFLGKVPEVIMERENACRPDKLNEMNPLDTFIEILIEDSEGIARRAAVSALLAWFKKSHIPPTKLHILYKSMVIASMDLDWEVKLITIDFWNSLINVTCSSDERKSSFHGEGDQLSSNSTLNLPHVLESVGFYGVAKNLAFDEDVTVRHKMVQTLEYLKTCRHFAAPDAFHQRNSLSSHNDSSNNLEMSSETLPPNDDDDDELMTDIKDKLINIESVLDTTDISTVQQIMAPIKTDRRCTNLNELLSKHHRHPGSVSTTDFLNWLNNLNIVSFLLQSDITTDPYNARPELLLDDILLDSYESEHEQENIRDCY